MKSVLFSFFALVAATGVALYQLYIGPLEKRIGVGRIVEAAGNKDCTKIEGLQACEKFVLHSPSGLIYLACSTPYSRSQWTPALDRLNPSSRSTEDYVAIYDPSTSRTTRLTLKGFTEPRGLNVHGLDVVTSSSDPNKLWVYMVNHRPPLQGDAWKVGANSVMEVFETTVGGKELVWKTTVEDDIIYTPNDVVGSPDGKSFWFTNEKRVKVGIMRKIDIYFNIASSSIGYCHLDLGCKVATPNLPNNNGIAKAPGDDGRFYVVNSPGGEVRVLEKQRDNTLVVTDTIKFDRALDNIMVGDDGAVYVASFPKAHIFIGPHLDDPSIPSPVSAHRITLNRGTNAYFGEKYKVDKIFEDDGHIASGVTTAAWDEKRKTLWLHGLTAPWFTGCRLPDAEWRFDDNTTLEEEE